jgi:hypothetical protein
MTRAPTQFRPSISPMSPAIAIVLSGVAWFLAVSWLNFVGEHGLNSVRDDHVRRVGDVVHACSVGGSAAQTASRTPRSMSR